MIDVYQPCELDDGTPIRFVRMASVRSNQSTAQAVFDVPKYVRNSHGSGEVWYHLDGKWEGHIGLDEGDNRYYTIRNSNLEPDVTESYFV